MNKKEEILGKIRNGVIISCQAVEPNPMATPETLLLFADCAVMGGCVGFRANMPQNVKIIKGKYPNYPIIGIWKIVTGDNPVYITPTMEAVDTLVSLGCEIVAMDATNRRNAQGRYAWELLKEVKEKYPDIVVMADIATIEDAKIAAREGADIVATTLSGYTEDTKEKNKTADFELVKAMKAANLGKFILTEGKIWTREDAVKAFECGADCVVVGTAVTNPWKITERFVEAVKEYQVSKQKHLING